jgi:predicted MPP superfamily phosphohydrolase
MRKRRALTFAALIVLALLGAGMLLSKYGLGVTRLELGLEGLPEGFDGFRIVQLSDLHGSRFGKGNARLIEKVRAEEPELIALTGDFLDEGKTERELPELFYRTVWQRSPWVLLLRVYPPWGLQYSIRLRRAHRQER